MARDETTTELLKPQYLRQYLADTGRTVQRDGQMQCPNAAAHKNGDKNPSAHLYENDGTGKPQVKCFACGGKWDIFQLWQLDNGGSFKDAKAGLCSRFGLSDKPSAPGRAAQPFAIAGSGADETARRSTGTGAERQAQAAKPNKDTKDYVAKCALTLQSGTEGEAGREYLLKRGISLETARRFNVGFDAAAGWIEGKKGGVIIPSGAGYFVRFLQEQERKNGAPMRGMYLPKGTPRPIFNFAALTKAAKDNTPVFIVEGEIDALSVAECGGVAVAVPVSGINKIFEEVQTIGGGVYVPCMDRDEAGEKVQARLEEGINAIIGAIVYRNAATELLPDNENGEHPKDANEGLQQDKAAFAARLAGVTDRARQFAQQEQKRNAPYFTMSDIGEMPPEEKNPRALFKGGYLRKGGGIIAASTAGAGKSTFSIQCAVHWVVGKPCFGITPVRALRVAIIQAEDDLEELAMFKANMLKGLTAEGWTVNEIQAAFDLLYFRKDFLGKTGNEFASALREMQLKDHYDLVIINPLNSYFEGDISLNADATEFFRKMIDPVIKDPKTECGILFIHHSGKPPKGKDAVLFGKGAFAQYSMQGAAELNNWARAVLVLYPFEGNSDFWTLTAAKRHKPLGWTDADGKPTKDFVIAYSTDCVYWRVPTAEEIAEAKRGIVASAEAKEEKETPAAAALRFAEYLKEKYPNGISLTQARNISRYVLKRPNSEVVMGWFTEHPEQYGLRKERQSDGQGKDGRKKSAWFLLPKDNTGLFKDGEQSEPGAAQAEPTDPDEDGETDGADDDTEHYDIPF